MWTKNLFAKIIGRILNVPNTIWTRHFCIFAIHFCSDFDATQSYQESKGKMAPKMAPQTRLDSFHKSDAISRQPLLSRTIFGRLRRAGRQMVRGRNGLFHQRLAAVVQNLNSGSSRISSASSNLSSNGGKNASPPSTTRFNPRASLVMCSEVFPAGHATARLVRRLAFAWLLPILRSMSRTNLGGFLQTRGLIWLLLAIILLFNGAIRWRLHGMPLERDEGEYAYAGQLLLQGIPPYKLAWNMKFPGTYYAYAALMSVFGQTPDGIHIGIILVTSLSTLLIFLIGRRLMGAVGGLVAAAIFTMLSALPFAYGLAGHATHFVVLFVCAGTFALLKMEGKKSPLWTLIAGVAFGCCHPDETTCAHLCGRRSQGGC